GRGLAVKLDTLCGSEPFESSLGSSATASAGNILSKHPQTRNNGDYHAINPYSFGTRSLWHPVRCRGRRLLNLNRERPDCAQQWNWLQSGLFLFVVHQRRIFHHDIFYSI